MKGREMRGRELVCMCKCVFGFGVGGGVNSEIN